MDSGPSSPSPTFQTDHSALSQGQPQTKHGLLACYLLVSHATSRSQRTYIGFTVNPSHRLKQHNGLLRYGGAHRTKKHRPWYNVAVIHGFTSKIQALQFEWAWQHPKRSLILKTHASRQGAVALPTKRITSVHGSLQTLAALVSVPPWSSCPLTLTICAERPLWQQYGIESLVLPPGFPISFHNLQSFEGYVTSYDYRLPSHHAVTPQSMRDHPCSVCDKPFAQSAEDACASYCAACGTVFHLTCFATLRDQTAAHNKGLIPSFVTCKKCSFKLSWSHVVRLAHVLQSDDD